MARAFPSSVAKIEQRLGVQWSAIRKAWDQTRVETEKLEAAIQGIPSSDMSFVVFGSLARGEWTAGSDLDWTLLIDGVVDPKHQEDVREVRRVLDELVRSNDAIDRRPGRERTFGGIAFSHPIVHEIGGENDTNRNVTQRILLLSESMAIGKASAYGRVLTAIIDRYVKEDGGLLFGSSDYRVPRFLLNDIVRYWRTVAVDFAYKQHTRGTKGMALRNVKLRLSRKLVFAAGVLQCFLCAEESIQQALASGVEEGSAVVATELLSSSFSTPLDVLAEAMTHFAVPDDTAEKAFSAYNDFIDLLDDDERRRILKDLEGFDHPLFEQGRDIGRRFDEALKEMFFDGRQGPGSLAALTRRYGVF